ncbi:hypothetical protein WG66_000330 [Moniliophthora roreri]|nr:hypothetical protein WG66_000330 [Moniliophthora roreri]
MDVGRLESKGWPVPLSVNKNGSEEGWKGIWSVSDTGKGLCFHLLTHHARRSVSSIVHQVYRRNILLNEPAATGYEANTSGIDTTPRDGIL